MYVKNRTLVWGISFVIVLITSIVFFANVDLEMLSDISLSVTPTFEATASSTLSATPSTPTETLQVTPSPKFSTTPHTPTPTSTPKSNWVVIPNKIKNNVGYMENWIVSLLWAIVRLSFLILALPLILFFINQLLQVASRSNQLVFDDVTNSTGDSSLDNIVKGLSLQARQWIAQDTDEAKKRVRKESQRFAGKSLQVDWVSNQISSAFDERAKAIIESMSEFVPAYIKPLLKLTNLFFPSKGTRISTTLMALRNVPLQPQVLYEMVDLENRYGPISGKMYEALIKKPNTQQIPENKIEENLNLPQNKALLNVGQYLLDAGQFEDATEFFQIALKNIPTDPDIPVNLAECLKRMKIRSSALASYKIGKELEEAGLLDQACTYYIDALPPNQQVEAKRNLEKILWPKDDISSKDKADAYLKLAQYYKGVFLDENTAEFYKLALRLGNTVAQTEFESWNKYIAIALCEASKILIELGHFLSAKKFLDLALTTTPNDPKVLSILAKLGNNFDTSLGSLPNDYWLATFYMKSGYTDQAEAYAKQALEDQPMNLTLQELRQTTLEEEGTLQRYMWLLRFASRYMVIELIKHELKLNIPLTVRIRILLHFFISKIPANWQGTRQKWFEINFPSKDQYLGKVYQFIGTLYRDNFTTQPNELWFKKTEEHFAKAIELMPNSGKPYYHLAENFYSALRKELLPQSKELVDKTIAYYEQAITLSDIDEDKCRAYLRKAIFLFKIKNTDSNDDDNFKISQQAIKDMLKVSSKWVQKPSTRNETKGKIILPIQDTEGKLQEKKEETINNLQTIGFHMDVTFTYSLACWYGLANKYLLSKNKEDKDAKAYYEYARHLIPCFLLRDTMKDVWGAAWEDSDLSNLLEGFSKLEEQILVYPNKYQNQEKTKLKIETFIETLKELTGKAGWTYHQPTKQESTGG